MSTSVLIIPIILLIITGLGVLLIIVGIMSILKARTSAVSIHNVERLAADLKRDNAQILSELTGMKETLCAIDKMMKEIE